METIKEKCTSLKDDYIKMKIGDKEKDI